MNIRDSARVYDRTEFADNPEARCSIVLILDVSGSMLGIKIATLNRALGKFRDIIREDSVTALRADVAVIEFDHEARIVSDFTNGTDFEAPVLAVKGGGTNYSKAVNLALDIIEARKQSYRDGGIAYYRSLVYFLTDGFPDDASEDLTQAAGRLAEMERNRGIAFFSFIIKSEDIEGLIDAGELAGLIGVSAEELIRVAGAGDIVSGADRIIGIDYEKAAELADISVAELMERCAREGIIRTPLGELSRLAPRPPVELTNMEQLEGSIQWLSRSVAAVSQSQPGDNIRLPQPDYLNL